jgi:hypothetical protein
LRPQYVALLSPRTYSVHAPSEEIREPVVHILDPRDESRIVTAIEVLSPSNKSAGPGRDSYLTKRQEYWDAGTNLVEIDLLRAGKPTARIEQENPASPLSARGVCVSDVGLHPMRSGPAGWR